MADVELDMATETIMSGVMSTESGGSYVRSTIEHDEHALPALIEFCDYISSEKQLSWRLLLFDENGITELDKNVYRGMTFSTEFH